jgi:hypothetical protein
MGHPDTPDSMKNATRTHIDRIDEVGRVAITPPGTSAFLDASARYYPMNTGVITFAIA